MGLNPLVWTAAACAAAPVACAAAGAAICWSIPSCREALTKPVEDLLTGVWKVAAVVVSVELQAGALPKEQTTHISIAVITQLIQSLSSVAIIRQENGYLNQSLLIGQEVKSMDNFDRFARASDLYELGEYAKAFDEFLNLAEQGDAPSMVRVAAMYSDGEGVERSFEKSLEWDKRAAELGELSALLNIGITYRNSGDARSARSWLEKAIAAGDGEAALVLAKMLMVSDKENALVKWCLTIACTAEDMLHSSLEEAQSLLAEIG
jgi:uncharacterized protein